MSSPCLKGGRRESGVFDEGVSVVCLTEVTADLVSGVDVTEVTADLVVVDFTENPNAASPLSLAFLAGGGLPRVVGGIMSGPETTEGLERKLKIL